MLLCVEMRPGIKINVYTMYGGCRGTANLPLVRVLWYSDGVWEVGERDDITTSLVWLLGERSHDP